MKVLDHFSVPYQGLKNGLHNFRFEVDNAFFKEFENSPIVTGNFVVNLALDKRPDLAIADFQYIGDANVVCDRCLEEFNMPLSGEDTLHIKFGESLGNEDEVMFVDPEISHINFAQFIYESICISLPMIVSHKDISECDQDVIKKMTQEVDGDEEVKDIWKGLQGLSFEDNNN